MINLRKFFIQSFFLAVVVIGTLLACLPSASADELPPPEDSVATVPVASDGGADDPCFRQDPECYIQVVECEDNVFVPLNPDGTWDCPVAEQLPEEVIGRQVDCPDGSVGRIVDTDLNTTCEPVATPTPTAEPTQTEEPLPDCTDPLVECACDHFIGGCTGGHPPDGEGTPFPDGDTETDPQASTTVLGAGAHFTPMQYGLAAVGLILTAAGTLYMIYRKEPER